MAESFSRLKLMNYYNYFTEIEQHFVRRRGKHLLVSPLDWGLIAAWKEAGIPLQVALRGIDIAMDKFFARRRGGSSKVNSLCYCHDSVMAEFASFLESHVGQSAVNAAPETESDGREAAAGSMDERGKTEALEYLYGIISEIKTLPAKQYFSEGTLEDIARVLARLEEIIRDLETGVRVESEDLERDLGIIDGVLVAALEAEISPEQMIEWEKEAKKELKVYRKRLPKEMYDKIRRNFMRNKIHGKFSIGELTLFRL